ncbi:unnamed protein product [Brassica oleracea]|uniref:(rape) hypothetical protein n=1 Tax=Brassica napus TaxID=3708 RepID=A0A816K5B7_BRANA|nr:unnamed protein product [Brassica napus]
MGDCVIGAFISILESVAINFGTNHIIKKDTTGSMCDMLTYYLEEWLIFYPKHIVSSAVDVAVWRLPYSRRYPR